jgi:predicted RNA binding protein YcfA (HicA-like mRNA interferase family)
MTFKELERLLLQDGWVHVDTRGSHHQYKHPERPGKITIPYHRGEVNIKTAQRILKVAGLK